MKKSIVFFIIFILFSKIIFASDISNILEDSLDSLNLKQYDTVINNSLLEYDEEFSFSDTVFKLIFGQVQDFSILNIFNTFLRIIFKEVFQSSRFMKNIIITAILCAILKVLIDSFKSHGIGEIGFYTGYIVVVTLVISSFYISIGLLETTISSIINILRAIAPLLAGILIMTGQAASATVFSTLLMSMLSITSFLVNNFFVPVITCATVLNTVNYIVPREILHNLVDFFKMIITASIRAIATIFISIISFQRVATPIANVSINKTARTIVGFIPVVGSAIGNAMDGVIQLINVIKGGVGLAIFIAIVLCCLFPILKLASIILIYKITAVIIEPISDKRLTSCISCVAEFTKLILSTLILFIFLFLFLILIILSISS